MRILLLFSTLVLSAASARSEAPAPTPIRVGPGEQAVLFSPQVRLRSRQLLEALQTAPTALDPLQQIVQDPALNAVQRDAVLYDLIDRVRQMPVNSLSPQAMAWLQNHPAQAVMTHEESVNFSIPLFDVAAAAQGLGNQWRFVAAQNTLEALNPDRLQQVLMRYAENPESPEARGLRAALKTAAEPALKYLAAQCTGNPELSAQLLPHVQLALGDIEALSRWLPGGEPARVAALLLSTDSVSHPALFEAALLHPDPGARGLAIARVTDAVLSQKRLQSDWSAQLWQLLDDPQMAATAALQLARIDALQPLSQLRDADQNKASTRDRVTLIRTLQRSLPDFQPEPRQ